MSASIATLLASGALGLLTGAVVAWWMCRSHSSAALVEATRDWQEAYEAEVQQKERVTAQAAALKKAIDDERNAAAHHRHSALASLTELESLRENAKALKKEAFSVGSERDELRNRLIGQQQSVLGAKRQLAELQGEFAKSRDFYKEQLARAFEQRKALERKVDDARSEHESVNNLLVSSKKEHESVSNMLAAAQARLEKLDALEQRVIELEADNAELRHEVTAARRDAAVLQRDVDELDALKVQNRELAHCLQSMENSRQQHEKDAARYRQQYDRSEQESDTLRMKLQDIETSLADMAEKQEAVRQSFAKREANRMPTIGIEDPGDDVDDLTEIVGIGKVFEDMLHELGIYYFRQIAAFGPAELARVNAELKEFKGRVEQDDWIGQAKDLHFRKYGSHVA